MRKVKAYFLSILAACCMCISAQALDPFPPGPPDPTIDAPNDVIAFLNTAQAAISNATAQANVFIQNLSLQAKALLTKYIGKFKSFIGNVFKKGDKQELPGSVTIVEAKVADIYDPVSIQAAMYKLFFQYPADCEDESNLKNLQKCRQYEEAALLLHQKTVIEAYTVVREMEKQFPELEQSINDIEAALQEGKDGAESTDDSVGIEKNYYNAYSTMDSILKIIEEVEALKAQYIAAQAIGSFRVRAALPEKKEKKDKKAQNDVLPAWDAQPLKIATVSIKSNEKMGFADTLNASEEDDEDEDEEELTYSRISFAAAPDSGIKSPFAGNEEDMKLMPKISQAYEYLREAMDVHNTLQSLQGMREIYYTYDKIRRMHDKSIEVLKITEQCTINYYDQLYENPHEMWSGGLSLDLAAHHDLRKGLSAWAYKAYLLAKAEDTGMVVDADDFAESDMDTSDIETDNIQNAHAQVENRMNQSTSSGFKDDNKIAELNGAMKETQLIPWNVGTEAAKMLAIDQKNSQQIAENRWKGKWGVAKMRYPEWKDVKNFYEQYILEKYDSINRRLRIINTNELFLNVAKGISTVAENKSAIENMRKLIKEQQTDPTSQVEALVAAKKTALNELEQKRNTALATNKNKNNEVVRKINEKQAEIDRLGVQLQDASDARQEAAQTASAMETLIESLQEWVENKPVSKYIETTTEEYKKDINAASSQKQSSLIYKNIYENRNILASAQLYTAASVGKDLKTAVSAKTNEKEQTLSKLETLPAVNDSKTKEISEQTGKLKENAELKQSDMNITDKKNALTLTNAQNEKKAEDQASAKLEEKELNSNLLSVLSAQQAPQASVSNVSNISNTSNTSSSKSVAGSTAKITSSTANTGSSTQNLASTLVQSSSKNETSQVAKTNSTQMSVLSAQQVSKASVSNVSNISNTSNTSSSKSVAGSAAKITSSTANTGSSTQNLASTLVQSSSKKETSQATQASSLQNAFSAAASAPKTTQNGIASKQVSVANDGYSTGFLTGDTEDDDKKNAVKADVRTYTMEVETETEIEYDEPESLAIAKETYEENIAKVKELDSKIVSLNNQIREAQKEKETYEQQRKTLETEKEMIDQQYAIDVHNTLVEYDKQIEEAERQYQADLEKDRNIDFLAFYRNANNKYKIIQNLHLVNFEELLTTTGSIIAETKSAAEEIVNETRDNILSINDLYNHDNQSIAGQLYSHHSNMIEKLKKLPAQKLQEKGTINNYQGIISLLQGIYTSYIANDACINNSCLTEKETTYFAGSMGSRRDFLVPITAPESNLPSVRETIFFDYADYDRIPKTPEGYVSPNDVVKKLTFLPDIWKRILTSPAFVEKNINLGAFLGADKTVGSRDKLAYGGMFPCWYPSADQRKYLVVWKGDQFGVYNNINANSVSVSSVLGGLSASGIAQEQEAYEKIKDKKYASCQNLYIEEIFRGFFSSASLSVIVRNVAESSEGQLIQSEVDVESYADFALHDSESELGYLFEYDGQGLKYNNLAKAVFGTLSEFNKGSNMQLSQKAVMYGVSSLVHSQIGEFLTALDEEQEMLKSMHGLEDEIQKNKESLKDIFAKIEPDQSKRFVPADDIDLSKDEDFNLIKSKLMEYRKNKLNAAISVLGPAQSSTHEVIRDRIEKVNNMINLIRKDTEAYVVLSDATDAGAELDEKIKTERVNREVMARQKADAERAFNEELQRMGKIECLQLLDNM